MKAILLLRQILPITLLTIGLAGCGGGDKPADDNATAKGTQPEGDGKTTPKPAEPVKLAAFIKGQRLWLVEPEGPGEDAAPTPDPDAKPDSKSDPDSTSEEIKCEPPTDKAEAPASGEAEEMFLQFNKDGSLQIGGRNEKGEAVAFPMDPDEKYTYTVKELVVTVLNNGKDEGVITFGSHEPKAGDEVTLAEQEQDKVTTKITKIEPATKLKAMEFELPPDPNANKPKETPDE